MPLEQKDLELIEHLLYKNSDEIGIAIGKLVELFHAPAIGERPAHRILDRDLFGG